MVLATMTEHVSAHESTQSLAAFNLADMLQNIFLMFFVESAATAFGSQAFGGKFMVEVIRALPPSRAAGVRDVHAFHPRRDTERLKNPPVSRSRPRISDLAGEFVVQSTLAISFTAVFTVIRCAFSAQITTVLKEVASSVSWSVSLAIVYLVSDRMSWGAWVSRSRSRHRLSDREDKGAEIGTTSQRVFRGLWPG